jgi:hypothetical protein
MINQPIRSSSRKCTTPTWTLLDEERFASAPESSVFIYMIEAEEIIRINDHVGKYIIWTNVNFCV